MEENKNMTDAQNNGVVIESYMDKPMPDLRGADSKQIAECIHSVLYDKKGRNIKTVKVEEKTIIADYFVLCTGNSGTQVKALAGLLVDKMKEAGIRALRTEGADERRSEWVAVDFGTVIVHIFTREAREFYDLDRLYGNSGEAFTIEDL